MATELRTPRRIVIPGGSGHVGRLLCEHFHAQGDAVTVLSRKPQPAPWTVLPWDAVTEGPWIAALDGADVCINLTGRSVDCRYNARNRDAIYHSRIDSTRLLGRAMQRLHHPPSLWMNASTATIYRHALDHPMDELTGEYGGNEPNTPDTWAFSIRVAKDWETAFFNAAVPGTRQIALRSAMVMDARSGSIFDVLSRLVRLGLGGTMGPGTQYISWIHAQDFVRAIEFLMADRATEGAVNLCAPHPLPNHDFLRALRSAWHVPFGLPATAWMLEIGTWCMRTETELVLKSRRVVPTRLQQAGFTFDYPEWRIAAQDLVYRMRTRT